jgi:hypothetical protein
MFHGPWSQRKHSDFRQSVACGKGALCKHLVPFTRVQAKLQLEGRGNPPRIGGPAAPGNRLVHPRHRGHSPDRKPIGKFYCRKRKKRRYQQRSSQHTPCLPTPVNHRRFACDSHSLSLSCPSERSHPQRIVVNILLRLSPILNKNLFSGASGGGKKVRKGFG